jgi:hypothetical protein
MDELDGRRQADMAKSLVAADLGRSERQHGAQSLAAGIDDVSRELGDQRDIAAHALEYQGIDVLQVAFNQAEQPVNSALLVDHALCQSLNRSQDDLTRC